jgi:hypothetical protein
LIKTILQDVARAVADAERAPTAQTWMASYKDRHSDFSLLVAVVSCPTAMSKPMGDAINQALERAALEFTEVKGPTI